MTAFVLLSIYIGLAVFVAGCVRRIVQYARTPLHLRWELYPVPHENRERAAYGGSYFEETDWWTKQRKRNLGGELRFMVPEVLLLRGLWEFNRKLWFRSFPFHLGLYLLIAGGMLSLANAGLEHWLAVGVLTAIAEVAAWIGICLILVGAAALLFRRMTDPELGNYTSIGDLFNVGAFAAASALTLAGRIAQSGPPLSGVLRALLTFDASLEIPMLSAGGLVTFAFLAGYVPFTQMGHFIAKYFTYHAVRWDDAPVVAKREMAARMAKQLTYKPTWSATHIGADGTRTWGEIATSTPASRPEVRR